jgi:hypothetical protein
MGYSPEETDSDAVGQEIPCLLWNWKFRYCVHERLPLDFVLSQMISLHTLMLCFFHIHFNIF